MKHIRVYAILLCCVLPLMHLAPIAGAAPAGERRELWTGSLYTSTYRAGVCIRGNGEIYGALYLRQASGAVDRYTLSGRVDGDRITAQHSSGHTFQGRFASEDRIRGTLTLKNGRRLDVRALRGPEPEVDEFCRLIQQQ